jgi:hypothetical protein
MLAILRKPMCMCRLKVVEGWKSRNINSVSRVNLELFCPATRACPK